METTTVTPEPFDQRYPQEVWVRDGRFKNGWRFLSRHDSAGGCWRAYRAACKRYTFCGHIGSCQDLGLVVQFRERGVVVPPDKVEERVNRLADEEYYCNLS